MWLNRLKLSVTHIRIHTHFHIYITNIVIDIYIDSVKFCSIFLLGGSCMLRNNNKYCYHSYKPHPPMSISSICSWVFTNWIALSPLFTGESRIHRIAYHLPWSYKNIIIIHIYVCTCTYICMYIHTGIHTYVHTYIHT